MISFTVFICGMCLMILELVGSRVLAPYIGTSIIVWSSLIGVILTCLSLGYYLGGKLADTKKEVRLLAGIIGISGCFILLLAVSHEVILQLITSQLTNTYLRALSSSCLLFAPASVLLGMVSPYAVALSLKQLKHSGRTVGSLYALSTFGSIVGTFLGGFILISFLGTSLILYLLAITLILLSSFLFLKTQRRSQIGVILLILSLNGLIFPILKQHTSLLLDTDSFYARIWIYLGSDPGSGKPVKVLRINNEISSASFLDSNKLVFPYTRYYRLAQQFTPKIERSLMLGGGAYSYPIDYLRSFPHATIDVVEIDPKVTQLAYQYFSLSHNKRLHIYHEDGRTFLNATKNHYDVIYGDAFKSYLPQYNLITKEATQLIANALTDNGVVLINVVSAIDGSNGQVFRALYHTYSSVFPYVYVFPVNTLQDTTRVQNIMLVATKRNSQTALVGKNEELAEFLTHQWKKPIPKDIPVLTDDFVPVERYALSITP